MGIGPHRRELARSLFKDQRGLCHYCSINMTIGGREDTRCTIDHIIPEAHGGTRERSNIVGACWTCNNARGHMEYHAFKYQVQIGGRPDNRPGLQEPERRHAPKVDRSAETAIKERDGKWSGHKLTRRPYLDDLGKHGQLGEALRAAGWKGTEE